MAKNMSAATELCYKCQLRESEMNKITMELKNSRITSLKLSGCNLRDDQFKKIWDLNKWWIKEWNFSSNNLTTISFNHVLSNYPYYDMVVNLSDNNISDKGIDNEKLDKIFTSKVAVNLDLSANRLSPEWVYKTMLEYYDPKHGNNVPGKNLLNLSNQKPLWEIQAKINKIPNLRKNFEYQESTKKKNELRLKNAEEAHKKLSLKVTKNVAKSSEATELNLALKKSLNLYNQDLNKCNSKTAIIQGRLADTPVKIEKLTQKINDFSSEIAHQESLITELDELIQSLNSRIENTDYAIPVLEFNSLDSILEKFNFINEVDLIGNQYP